MTKACVVTTWFRKQFSESQQFVFPSKTIKNPKNPITVVPNIVTNSSKFYWFGHVHKHKEPHVLLLDLQKKEL